MNATPLNLNDLEVVSPKDAALQNAVVSATYARVYKVAGQELVVGLAKEASDEALKVALQFNGQNIVLSFSQSLVNSLLIDEGISLPTINIDVLNLLVRLKVLPKLPQGVQFKDLSLTGTDAFEQPFQVLPRQVVLRGMTKLGESLSWDIAIYALPQVGLGAFLKGFDFLISEIIPSPLLKARVPMPIIAATTAVPAEQLSNIAIGDVILFG